MEHCDWAFLFKADYRRCSAVPWPSVDWIFLLALGAHGVTTTWNTRICIYDCRSLAALFNGGLFRSYCFNNDALRGSSFAISLVGSDESRGKGLFCISNKYSLCKNANSVKVKVEGGLQCQKTRLF